MEVGEKNKISPATVLKMLPEKLNAYFILQLVWLIELYFLGFNSLLVNTNSDVGFQLPAMLSYYNDFILEQMATYSSTVLILAKYLFLSGILFSFLALSYFGSYQFVKAHAGYGIYGGVWLFVIWFTYQAYISWGLAYFLIPILLAAIHQAIRRMTKQRD